MNSSDLLKAFIISYLYARIGAKDLRIHATPLALSAGDAQDRETLRISNGLLASFSDMDLGHLSEEGLKLELTNLLFGQSSSQYLQFKFGSFASQPQTETSTTTRTESFGFAGKGRETVYA